MSDTSTPPALPLATHTPTHPPRVGGVHCASYMPAWDIQLLACSWHAGPLAPTHRIVHDGHCCHDAAAHVDLWALVVGVCGATIQGCVRKTDVGEGVRWAAGRTGIEIGWVGSDGCLLQEVSEKTCASTDGAMLTQLTARCIVAQPECGIL